MSGGGSGRRSNRVEPKVVIINTKYVETDARNFKSVVQELTGKDAKVMEEGEKCYDDRRHCSSEVVGKSGGSGRNLAVLLRDMSFKDFDRLLKDMPTVDELCGYMD